MKNRSVVVALALGAITLAACSGLKDALTAHTDVAARTVSRELSAGRLGELIGKARIGVDPSKDNAQIVADLWVDYQRLGYAAAHNDTLTSTVSKTVQPLIDNMRVTMMIDTLRAKVKLDTGNAEAAYNAAAGGMIGARHLLFAYPLVNGQPGTATPSQKDSVRKFAASIFPQITPANFQAMIKKYSGDPGSKDRGGSYGLFPKAQMVPEFSNAAAALKPGEISKSLVESPYGLHVIQRLPYSEVKKEWEQSYGQIAQQQADSTISANMISGGKLTVKDNAATPVKDALKDLEGHHSDHTTLATFNGGEMTVGNLVTWIDVMPMQTRQQVMQLVPTWPDSQVKSFVKNMAIRQLLLHKADSAKIDVAASDKAGLTSQFTTAVVNAWMQLNVAPASLADSGKSVGDREKIAGARIDTLLARIMNGEANPVGVIVPIKSALASKWEANISTAGIDRAVELARKVRASADSARANAASSVPVPGAGAQQAPVQPPPQQAAPAPATKPPASTKKKP